MGNGTIDIDDIKGEVSAVSLGGAGSITAKNITVNGPLTIINNPTKEDLERLKNVKHPLLTFSDDSERPTTQKVEETKEGIDWLKNLLKVADRKVGAQTQAIRAGNLEISRDELLSREAGVKAYEAMVNGDYDNSLSWSNRALQLDPSRVQVWYNRGIAFAELSRYNEAIESYEEALRIDPNYIGAWVNRGKALLKLGRYDEALKSSDEALQIDPNSALAWFNKGIVFGLLNRHNEAIECFDAALQIDPNYAKAWYLKGFILKKLGRLHEANQHFNKSRQLGYEGE